MISVVIPLYNKENQIADTIRSVLAQTCQEYEIVIVDDGSTDRSVDVIKSIKDSRIRIIQQTNAGVSAARNRGIEETRGEFIAFLDADDEWKTDYLSTQMNLVKKYPHCDIFATNYEFRDSQGKVFPTIINRLPFIQNDGELTNYFEVASCSHPPLWTSAVMVRKQAILSIGGFPVGVKSGEDLLTWARLSTNYKIAYCKETKVLFRVEGYRITEKPKRIPAENDVVGRGLKLLLIEKHPKHIKAYISLWHKMRSSIYLRLNMRRKSIHEAIIGLSYDLLNYKLYVYIFLNLIPSKFRPF